MLNNISRAQLIGGWAAAVIVLMACSVVVGAEFSAGAVELWLVAGVVPPAVIMLLWHDAPPISIAQMLNCGNSPSKEGRS